MYLGDFNLNQTVRYTFPSTNANGTPTALANGTVVVYKDGSTSEITANLTLTASLDSRPGVNQFVANMSANTTNFSSGSDYAAVLTVGDVDGVSVANMTLCQWSVLNRPAGIHAINANSSLSNGTANGGGGITMPAPINTFGQFESQTGTGASLALPTQPSGARGAILTPSGGSIVWRGDGGDAASDGSTLAAGGTIAIANIEDFRWCASASVALKIQWLR